MLRDFIVLHREEILARARSRVIARNTPTATQAELSQGLPAFLDELGDTLQRAASHETVDGDRAPNSADQHGHDLFDQGVTVAQVVHDYGDLCQVITGMAVEEGVMIGVDEFRKLNLSLDHAIADAVTAYSHRRERAIADEGRERLGILAHEMRNLLNAAMLSFASIKKGIVAPGGSTSAVHDRSLIALNALIDRSLAEVRLDGGLRNVERVPVWEVIAEVEIGASMVAQSRGLRLAVANADHAVMVDADRQLLAAAISNLLQNALKFTRPDSTVCLRTITTTSPVFIDIEDECGGLPPGKPEALLQPFVQLGRDRSGLGLGLSICSRAVKALAGELRIRNLAGKGCVFTIDLPRQPPPPTMVRAPKPLGSNGKRDSSSGTTLAI